MPTTQSTAERAGAGPGRWLATMAVLLGACAPPASVRVGHLDGTQVIRVTRRGKQIRQRIQHQSELLEKKLSRLQAGVKTLDGQVALLAGKRPPTDAERQAKERALVLAKQQLRTTHLRYQKELNVLGQRLLGEFKNAIRRAAMAVRGDLGLDLVVMTSRNEGLWLWPVVDITARVVRRLDRVE